MRLHKLLTGHPKLSPVMFPGLIYLWLVLFHSRQSELAKTTMNRAKSSDSRLMSGLDEQRDAPMEAELCPRNYRFYERLGACERSSSAVGHLTDSRIFSVSMKRVIKPAGGASNTGQTWLALLWPSARLVASRLCCGRAPFLSHLCAFCRMQEISVVCPSVCLYPWYF